MAEITRRRQGELLRGLFKALWDFPDGRPARDAIRATEELVPATPFENSMYPNSPNVRRYEKIVRFSTIGPVKAGWLVKENGVWHLTEEGRQAYGQFTDPAAFFLEARRLYKAWKREQPVLEDETEDVEAEVAEKVGTLEEADEQAWEQIREHLVRMPPYDFQNLVAALLRAMGYYVQWVAPPGPDRGIDVVAYRDPLGTAPPRIMVQVKRQSETKTAVDGIRAFMAVLGDQDVGIFVSAGGFTSEADREARSQERRRLTLVDLRKLVNLWIENYDRLDDVDRQLLPLKPVHFLAPIGA
jgi:restriction system protein